jgi:hypothetical protein
MIHLLAQVRDVGLARISGGISPKMQQKGESTFEDWAEIP